MSVKHLAGVLLVAFATGCTSGSPTAPSSTSPASVLPDGGAGGVSSTIQKHGQGQTSTGQKVTIFYYSYATFERGNQHIVGLPVHVMGDEDDPTPYEAVLYTDRQGSITFTIPEGDDSLVADTPDYEGYCASTHEVELPLYQRVTFIEVTYDPVHCVTQ
jgi:hypothetical protein